MNKQHQDFVKTHFFKDGLYSSTLARWCKEDFAWLGQYEGESISERSWNVLYTRPICVCGKKTSFIDFRSGYRRVCSRACAQKALASSKSTRHSSLWNNLCWAAQTSGRMKASHFESRAQKKLDELLEKQIVPLDDLSPGFDNEYRWQHVCGEIFTKSFKRTYSIYCPKCHVSKGQGQLYELIRQNYGGQIIVNDRSAIAPLEIDIFLPEISLGFEFNGKYWHTSGGLREEQKTFEATEAGIKLIHVWEVQWNKSREQIQAEVLSALRA